LLPRATKFCTVAPNIFSIVTSFFFPYKNVWVHMLKVESSR
jgi:hypothetical protein